MLPLDSYNHLFKSEAEMLAYKSAIDINKIYVGHPSFMDSLNGIQHCMKATVFEREPMNCMLLADGGFGKTTLANYIIDEMHPETIIENNLEIRTVPAFYTSFKNIKTLDAIAADMLRKLNDPYPTKGKTSDKAERIFNLLKTCKTIIMFIDELHDLDGFESEDKSKLKEFFKWLKTLSNECGPMICVMGKKACDNIFLGDLEMERRFKNQYFLERLSPGTRNRPGYLGDFLESVVEEIKKRTLIKNFPLMSDYLMVLRVYMATGGSPEYIMTMFKAVVRNVILEGKESAKLEDFAMVWASSTLNAGSIMKSNPFLASENQIAAELRKKL